MGIMTVRRMGIGSRRYRLACKGAVVVHGAKEGHQVVVGSIIVRCHIVSSKYDRASYCRLVFVSGRRCSRELQGSSKWECQQFNIGGNKLKEKVSTKMFVCVVLGLRESAKDQSCWEFEAEEAA